MIRLEAHPLGTILSVRARPGARRNAIEGCHDGALKVSVTQAPEKGKANKAIVALLSKTLALRKSRIELLSGETSPRKRFLLRDATPEQIQPRVDAIEGA